MRRYFLIVLVFSALFYSCAKNSVSKIPHISLIAMQPQDSFLLNKDTLMIVFKFTDGDGDLRSDASDTFSGVYLKDSRFDSAGFVKSLFPIVNPAIEDPKKGLTGICYFFPYPQPTPRDSSHYATGDTLTYELYIVDKAQHESNHIVTQRLIIRP